MRIEVLKKTGPTTITKAWHVNGTQSDVGDVTYTVLDPSGSSIASGSAAKAGSATTTTYSFSLAIQTAVSEFTIEWTRTDTGAKLVDACSIVGSVLFTEAEARGFLVAGGIAPLADENAYSDDAIADARARVTSFIERRTHHSPIRRYARARFRGSASSTLLLIDGDKTHGGAGYYRNPIELIAASVNGTALTPTELAAVDVEPLKLVRYDGNSWSKRDGDNPPKNIVVEYEYGDSDVDFEANRAGLLILLASIVPSDVSSRATSYSNQDGTFRLSMPSPNYPTGIPEVDEFLNVFDERPLFR